MDHSLNQRELTQQAQDYIEQEQDDGMAELQYNN